MSAAATPRPAARAPVPATRLARSCRALPCLATDLADHLLGLDPIGDFAALVETVFPLAEERAALDQLAARYRAATPAPGEEAARVRAFIELVGERRFPVYDFSLWDEEEATCEALLDGLPFARYGWSYDDLHDDPETHRPGHNLLRAVAADPYDGLNGGAGRGALLDHLARVVPPHLLAPLADGGLTANSLRTRLGGTRFAPAADFARWLTGETGLVCLDCSDEDGTAEVPWSRHVVALLAAQWPLARALLDGIDELAGWLEGDPAARFAALLAAAGLTPRPATADGAP